MSERVLRVGMLGCGTVGAEVVRLLDEQAADLAARIGAPLELAGIAVRVLPLYMTDVAATAAIARAALALGQELAR